MFNKALLALALIGVAASAQSAVEINEGFDNVPGLADAGWVQTNNSAGGTTNWYQGTPSPATPSSSGIFSAQSGPANSYIAANYKSAATGSAISNYLITPLFSTAEAVFISFWARGVGEADYFDQFAYGFSTGSNLTSAFALGPIMTATPGDWTQYRVNLGNQGINTVGRFAIEYTGQADNADYFGVDSLVVQVPEPSTWIMLGIGLLTLFGVRRRNRV